MEKAKTPTKAAFLTVGEMCANVDTSTGWTEYGRNLVARCYLALERAHAEMIDKYQDANEDAVRSPEELAAQKARAQAFASLVALAERSSAVSVNLGMCSPSGAFGSGAWCCTIEFVSGDLLDAVADSPEAAVKAVEAKMQEREDIQSVLMEDT